MDLSQEEVDFLSNHLFLPYELPQADDRKPHLEDALLQLVADAATTFADLVPQDQRPAARLVIQAVSQLRSSRNESGAVDSEKLLRAMRSLATEPTGFMIPLHINEQNAAFILSTSGSEIVCEAFELSPLNEAVMSTSGRLRRCFPGPAVSIPINMFDDAEFQSTLANTLSKMSMQPAIGMIPTVRKSRNNVQEIRDTTHPGLVTEFLVSVLGSFSSAVDIPRIWKHTREEVLWQNALFPWRRSPLWLLMRVMIQLQFVRAHVNTDTHSVGARSYKLFMIHLLATFLDRYLEHKTGVESDKLQCMVAKLVGRILKLDLDTEDEDPGASFVKQVLFKAKAYLQQRHDEISTSMSGHLKLDNLKNLDFEKDATLDLPKLDAFLAHISARASAKEGSNFQPAAELLKLPARDIPKLSIGTTTGYKMHNLHAFEQWVSHHLPGWLNGNISGIRTCQSIRSLMQDYHNEARSLYTGNPEAWSIMILTTLELWAACDTSAIVTIPLLAAYDPGIPQDLFQYLLLPFREQMVRLRNLEVYIEARRRRARYGAPGSIFKDFGTGDSFGERFFDQSDKHQNLHQKIERDANLQRERKQEELFRKKQLYKEHMHLYEQSECEYFEREDRWGDVVSVHSRSCRRCSHKEEAKNINIQVHEWPLPQNSQQLKSVIFELDPPVAFCEWRDATLYLLLDVLELQYRSKDRHCGYDYRLARCVLLAKYYSGGTHRICLLSEVKPHVVTHRKILFKFPNVTGDDVCLNNGPSFRYFDTDVAKHLFTSNIISTEAVLQRCSFGLPAASLAFRPFIDRRFDNQAATPNHVIATQSECPAHLSLAEYRALASIPVGHRIGWENILVQVRSPLVDFKKPEVSFLFFQTMYQAGPVEADGVHRASHSVLANVQFARSLQREIREAANRVKENWESVHALGVLISIGCRQLSLASLTLVHDALRLLLDLQVIACSWISFIQKKYQEAQDDSQRAKFQEKIVEAALVCCGTFDVEDEHLHTILSGDTGATQASTLIRCGILIHDNYASTQSKTHGNLVSLLHRRWQKLMFRAYPLLAKLIFDNGLRSCLDDSIKANWPTYNPGNAWVLARSDIDYWVCSNTDSHSERNVRLHFNLLTGNLLVNGLPLSRLPSQFENHPTYHELFGKKVLQIIPTSTPGMRFCVQGMHEDHSVQFGFSAPDLIIQATKNDRTSEVLPRSLFSGQLPDTFVEDYCHWYDAASNTITFRKQSSPWQPDRSTWTLSRDGAGWRLEKLGTRLISPRSPTGKDVASVFAPVQTPSQINIVLSKNKERLEIEIPNMQLEFYLDRGTSSVISRKLRGLEVDGNQSIGTLVGLRSKLVLIDPLSGDRRVLIPAGSVILTKCYGHISATITPAPTSPFVYKVDQTLQRLTDNGDLQSKFFLCYLHGITSFCVPDPLTCRTGTEQALSILKSEAVKSFQLLTDDNLQMLQKIDAITPRRSYYPPSEQVMQTVRWNAYLPCFSQHPHFHIAVEELFQHYQSTELFHSENYVRPPSISGVHRFLLDRDSQRSSRFRVSCFGAEDFTIRSDRVYIGRDNSQSSNRSQEARKIATMLFRRDGVLYRELPSHPHLAHHILKKLKDGGEVKGPTNLSPSLPCLGYDSLWLEDKHSKYWAEIWCWLHRETRSLSNTSMFGKFSVMMWFATMAFAPAADLDMLHSAAAMFLLPQVQAIKPVERRSFALDKGGVVNTGVLQGAVSGTELPFERSPEHLMNLMVIYGETKQAQRNRRRTLHRENKAEALTEFVRHLSEQYPTSAPTRPDGHTRDNINKYFDIEKAMTAVRPLFTAWHDNRLFGQYIMKFGEAVGCEQFHRLQAPTLCFKPPPSPTSLGFRVIKSADLFASNPPETFPEIPPLPTQRLIAQRRVMAAQPHLETLVRRLESKPGSRYEQQYAKELRESANELNLGSHCLEYILGLGNRNQLRFVLEEYLASSEQHMSRVLDSIVNSVRRSLGSRSFAEDLFQSPRLSSTFLLQQLSTHGWAVGGGWNTLSKTWKIWIAKYGEAVAQVQRAKRLLKLFHDNKEIDLIRELQSEAHTNWSPSEYPEALLLEIENSITIREVQADIAQHMMNPPESQNAVMQLNMGEGKSSVIVPMVSSALADGSKLVRVVVAKPQSRQMFHMLMVTLGGMINRRIFHLPFSRAIRLDEGGALAIAKQCRQCQEAGGIMLLQPEHILSFKLMGLETCISGKEEVSRCLLQTQHIFDINSRDIVDESDENFSVKFELIYPLGSQRSINFAPNRWNLIQTVLNIVRDHAKEVSDTLPESFYFREGHAGSFPRIRILKQDATTLMLSKVATYICTKGFSRFPISRQDLETRQAVLKYISQPVLSAKEISDVEEGPFWIESTQSYLWLLRGLFAKGILAFVYGQKRWKVNYGLDKSRNPPTDLAVPYRAKDSPTPRSEFSHPDVVIALTCNSYYYQGLTDEELFLAFEHLMESDQADAEYEDWKRDAFDLPPAFRQLIGINLGDALQCQKQIFPSFCYAKRTIDYYLEHIIFPRHMKEFPKKLTASGWDLGAVKTHPTTGFSGTIDSHKVLPLDVSYLDLHDQKHTNARVLEYLLRPENSVILLPEPPRAASAQTSDAEELLRVVLAQYDKNLRVILDVGAQILELTNAKVAQTWLRMAYGHDPSVQAVIYFDDNEELVVLDVKGAISPLQISPYLDQLDMCLVFLDEAHTRGTDLKLPVNYKAAVTIGPSLTKDRLVQACMRMRKLGKGQSVVFCVPTEVQRKIHELQTRHIAIGSQTQAAAKMDVLDILEWSISETIVDLQKSMPLWATQGERFDRQEAYWKKSTIDHGTKMTKAQAAQFLEDEAVTLENRYRPQHQELTANASMPNDTPRLQAIQNRCSEVGAPKVDEVSLQEEQERELSPEIEEERQIEKPSTAKPAKHSLHQHLTTFVSTGDLPTGSPAVMPAFQSLQDTSAAESLCLDLFPKDILVTVDFANTVRKSSTGRYLSDAFQRPVQWILTSQPRDWSKVIIISPWEANELMPGICKSTHVTLHVYCARPNQGIEPLDRLDLFSVPSSPADWSSPFPLRLMVQLNLFAGQLYLKSADEYAQLCRMLRLSREEATKGVKLDPDGFILTTANSGLASDIIRTSTFTQSPVRFLNLFLIKSRRDCQAIEKTHLGKILSGALLRDEDFDEDDDCRYKRCKNT